MKAHNYLGIICFLLIVSIVFGCLFIYDCWNYARNRREFINELYYHLVDVKKAFDEMDLDEVRDELMLLDVICDKQRKFTNGGFYYENRGNFLEMCEAIDREVYNPSDLQVICGYIQEAIVSLSVDSGNAENITLTYKQVGAILVDLFSKVDVLTQHQLNIAD